MIEILAWTFHMIPGLVVFVIAAFIIIGFTSGFICYRIARRVNYKQWPEESREKFIQQEETIRQQDEDINVLIQAYNERYSAQRQCISIMLAVDNKIKRRRKS